MEKLDRLTPREMIALRALVGMSNAKPTPELKGAEKRKNNFYGMPFTILFSNKKRKINVSELT